MKINTKFIGEVDVQKEDIIAFKNGMPGFPELQKFVLLPIDADIPLALLQSIERKEIGFVVAYPFAFKKDYEFDISEEDKLELQIEKEEDVIAYTIMTLKDTITESTINLLAPVVINVNKKLGKQIVLQDHSAFPLRYPIGAVEGSAK